MHTSTCNYGKKKYNYGNYGKKKQKKKYGYYKHDKKHKEVKREEKDTCIIPHINAYTGKVTSASCAPETMPATTYSTSSYYGSKYDPKSPPGCCDGYLCNDGRRASMDSTKDQPTHHT